MVHPKITPPLPFSLLHSPKNPHPHANHPQRCQRAAPPSPRHPSAVAPSSLRLHFSRPLRRAGHALFAHPLHSDGSAELGAVHRPLPTPTLPVQCAGRARNPRVAPPPPSHRRSRISPTSMGSLDLGAAQEDHRHSRRRTRSSSGFLLLPCRMGLLAGDILPSHPQVTPSIPRCCHTLSHSSACPRPYGQIDLFGSLKLGLVLWIFATPVDT